MSDVVARHLQRGGERVFTPEMFGARGDGRTDDSAAMAALSRAVSQAGGGTIVFRRTTYLVGAQSSSGPRERNYAFEPARLLEFEGCRGPLVIRGNGARMRCADGLRYGVFDGRGNPLERPMPYIGPGLATPYRYMIRIADCTGPVEDRRPRAGRQCRRAADRRPIWRHRLADPGDRSRPGQQSRRRAGPQRPHPSPWPGRGADRRRRPAWDAPPGRGARGT